MRIEYTHLLLFDDLGRSTHGARSDILEDLVTFTDPFVVDILDTVYCFSTGAWFVGTRLLIRAVVVALSSRSSSLIRLSYSPAVERCKPPPNPLLNPPPNSLPRRTARFGVDAATPRFLFRRLLPSLSNIYKVIKYTFFIVTFQSVELSRAFSVPINYISIFQFILYTKCHLNVHFSIKTWEVVATMIGYY